MDGLARVTEGFHYTDCGLDYVYLTSGYTIHKTDHGTGVSIENARQLHERLALDEHEHGAHGLRDIRLKNDGIWTREAA